MEDLSFDQRSRYLTTERFLQTFHWMNHSSLLFENAVCIFQRLVVVDFFKISRLKLFLWSTLRLFKFIDSPLSFYLWINLHTWSYMELLALGDVVLTYSISSSMVDMVKVVSWMSGDLILRVPGGGLLVWEEEVGGKNVVGDVGDRISGVIGVGRWCRKLSTDWLVAGPWYDKKNRKNNVENVWKQMGKYFLLLVNNQSPNEPTI